MILILGIFFINRHKIRIRQYFAEEGYYRILQNLHIIKRCYQPYQDFEDIFEQEGFNYIALDRMTTTESIIKLSEDIIVKDNKFKIPPISHHIYFSQSNILNDFYFEKIKANFERLNSLGVKWKHFLWTNKPSLFDKEITSIEGVVIKDPEEFKDSVLYNIFQDSLKKGEGSRAYYAEASDILRFMLIQKYGGIYNDMDYEIYDAEKLTEYMKKFDFIGGRETTKIQSYYGSSFFAAKPNHPVLNEAIARRYRNSIATNIPDYVKYPCYSNDFIYFNSPPLLTIAYFAKNNIDGNNDIILPSWVIFNHDFARFKNKTCHYTEINREQFRFDAGILKQILADFKDKDENHKSLHNFSIIGADMFCGNWYDDERNKKEKYYWNW